MSFSAGRLFTMAAASASAAAATYSTATLATSPSSQDCPSSASVTHFIVLVHGWMGNAQEMKYMEESLEREASKQHHPSQRFVIVSPTVNEGMTHDGIAAGGERLATAVKELVASHDSDDSEMTTLSFVGNSLGGLYSRYAISKLSFPDLGLMPLAFYTTATPHLGVSKHTYIPLPRFAEWTVAHILQPTGKDLFSVTPLIHDMAILPQYREPLQHFYRRVAYANAFATDFQVPTCTAAFLCPQSPHPHYHVDTTRQQQADDDDSGIASNNDYFVLTVETPRTVDPNVPTTHLTMAHALDTLSWTKVFCDNRNNIPLPSLPLPFTSEAEIQEKAVYTSSEIIPMVTSVGTRFNIPIGHQVLVANSKSGWYSTMSAGGRPIVDRMAVSLIDDIVQFTNEQQQQMMQASDGSDKDADAQAQGETSSNSREWTA